MSLSLNSSAIASVLGLALALGAPHALAAYPDRPIVIIVGFPPGGGVDTVARVLARDLSRLTKQSVVIENKPGAAGAIAAAQAARAPADGYTYLLADPAFVINTGLMRNVGYDLKRDFTAVSTVTISPLVLAVSPKLPASNVPDVIKLAGSKPDGLTFGSSGIGTTPHLAGEMLRAYTQANLTHVPYKGTGQAMADLVGGQLDVSFATIASANPFIQQKTVRPIATTGPSRAKAFPDLPAVAESIPGFQVLFWTGLFAPAGTPPGVIKTMNEAVRTALADAQTQKTLEASGGGAVHMPVDKATAFFDDELQRWMRVIAEAKIKPE